MSDNVGIGLWIYCGQRTIFREFDTEDARQRVVDLLEGCIKDLLADPSKRWPIRILDRQSMTVIMSHKLTGFHVGPVDKSPSTDMTIRERATRAAEIIAKYSEKMANDGEEWRGGD